MKWNAVENCICFNYKLRIKNERKMLKVEIDKTSWF